MHAESMTGAPRTTLPPYLVWGAAWFAFFLFAANVRVGTMLWDPVFRWAFVQASALERITGDLGRLSAFAVGFAVYIAIGALLALNASAMSSGRTQRMWMRAGLAWAALQVAAIAAAFLVT